MEQFKESSVETIEHYLNKLDNFVQIVKPFHMETILSFQEKISNNKKILEVMLMIIHENDKIEHLHRSVTINGNDICIEYSQLPKYTLSRLFTFLIMFVG